MTTDRELGLAIRAAREAAGISQNRFAGYLKDCGLGFWQVTVSRIELGERSVRAVELGPIAQVLGVTVASLLGLEASRPEQPAVLRSVLEEIERGAVEALRLFNLPRHLECAT